MFFHLFLSQMEKEEKCAKNIKSTNTARRIAYTNRKNVKTPKKKISTSEQHARHPFAGQNTQQVDVKKNIGFPLKS